MTSMQVAFSWKSTLMQTVSNYFVRASTFDCRIKSSAAHSFFPFHFLTVGVKKSEKLLHITWNHRVVQYYFYSQYLNLYLGNRLSSSFLMYCISKFLFNLFFLFPFNKNCEREPSMLATVFQILFSRIFKAAHFLTFLLISSSVHNHREE
jgi:hypothetical protein